MSSNQWLKFSTYIVVVDLVEKFNLHNHDVVEMFNLYSCNLIEIGIGVVADLMPNQQVKSIH
jgi:hypothetical protein